MKNWIPTNIDDFIIFKVEGKEILNFESSLSLKIWTKKIQTLMNIGFEIKV
jgi:hypothetical protein